MAAGDNGAPHGGPQGASTPEDDDPFGYLYADGQAAGAQPPGQGGYGYPGPTAQPGRPRTSYNQVRAVGERQYGYPAAQSGQARAGYGYPPPAAGQGAYGQQSGYGQAPAAQPLPPQQPYGQPHPQYAAPETYPGGPPNRPAPQGPPPGRGGRRGPNTKGLLIGAIAVVLVVVAGITVALLTNGSDKDKADDQAARPSTAPEKPGDTSPSAEPSPSGSKSEEPAELPKQDAATLQLGAPAQLGTDTPGAQGVNGAYVMFNGTGGSASWSAKVPEDGEYTLYITYSVPGKDAKTSLTVNGEQPRGINMKNFAHAKEGDWEKGWTRTYSYVNLKKGDNTLKMSCEQGDTCDAYMDQVWLVEGRVE
ncbi:carbohydrate-binding protein [Streptomyces sp. NPDC047097]|uniref:carbohydrate-binding protein n=1 Tax=Streptomyces sp. NPDC047097 TaxID=3155260 RepID=UPI0033F7F790